MRLSNSITPLVEKRGTAYDLLMRMIDSELTSPHHGGDVSAAQARFGAPAEGWIDLSTGINPNPYPDTTTSQAVMANLPTSAVLSDLLRAAHTNYGLAERAPLCAAPGTQAILQILPEIISVEGPVAVLSPTYSEHAHLWRHAGHRVMEIDELTQIGDAKVVVVVNPNNPDGRCFDIAGLDAVRSNLADAQGLLIVDEAFADVTPGISMASLAGQEGLIILRSFGKFFGLAGIRLGFAAGPTMLIDQLVKRLGPWAVSGPAIEIGTRALSDQAWIEKTRRSLIAARQCLDDVLISSGLEIIGGTDLFRLTQVEDANTRYEQLGQAGILVRRFEEQPGWLRFGLPGDAVAFERLSEALAS